MSGVQSPRGGADRRPVPGRPQTDTLRDVHRGGVSAAEPRSLLTVPLVWLIRLYQATISPIFGPVCGYYPSCSAYGVTALERHGLVRGSLLTVWRVLRCNPWARGGVDHVPPRRASGRRPRDEIPAGSVSTPQTGPRADEKALSGSPSTGTPPNFTTTKVSLAHPNN